MLEEIPAIQTRRAPRAVAPNVPLCIFEKLRTKVSGIAVWIIGVTCKDFEIITQSTFVVAKYAANKLYR
jgi:hypothetical protein